MGLIVPGKVVGVVHLRPLPGSPDWRKGGSMADVIEKALADAASYEVGGANGIFIENFGDVPFTAKAVGSETVAAMAAVGRAVHAAVEIPVGFNVLRNDAVAALGLCAACGGEFIRVNVHTGSMLTDQGMIEGTAYETVRRRAVLCPEVKILADVLVKHAVPVEPQPIEHVALDTLQRGRADGLIVSGSATGAQVSMDELRRVREACPEAPLFVGSGVNEENVSESLEWADGVIVGSSLKKDGILSNPVDVERVKRLVDVVRG